MWTKGVRSLNRLIENITAVFLSTMVILIFVQVFSRQVVGSSFAWTEEISRFLMIWITFLGASVAFQHGAHIGIEYFKEKVPSIVAKIFNILAFVACSVFFYFMVAKGFEIMDKSMLQTSAALKIPMGYLYFVIPLSGFLMFINLLDVTFIKTNEKAKM